MPLPTPKKDEQQSEFISRCISELTNNEKDRFPKKDQRVAICYYQWEKAHKEKSKDD